MEQQELIQLQEQVRLKKQIELIEENAKKFLSKEALNRFGNLKLEAVNQGHIKEQLSDKEFLNLLRMIEEPKKEFRLKK